LLNAGCPDAEKRAVWSASRAKLPKKGDRVDVEFAQGGSFVGTVTAGPRRVAAKGKGKKGKVMADSISNFDVLFDADGVTVTVSQDDLWSFH